MKSWQKNVCALYFRLQNQNKMSFYPLKVAKRNNRTK